MLLFTQSRQVGFALSITKLKIKKKYVNLCDHRNSAINIVTDTCLPAMITKEVFFSIDSKNFTFWDNWKKNYQATASLSASNRLILVFRRYLEMFGNRQKPKRNYVAADDQTDNFQGLASF